MSTREDSLKYLEKLYLCWANTFFSEVDDSQKGVDFILSYLQNSSDEVIAGDLARELNVSTARIAALLKTMEKKNFITRHHSPEDSRKTIVEITPEGIEHIAEVHEKLLDKLDILFEKVGKKDLEEFLRILNKIKTAFDE